MIASPLSLSKFASAWLPALAVATVVDPAPRLADAFAFTAGGVTLPPVTCILGALGIALARPLARKREAGNGLGAFVLVTVIMLLVVELWVIESQPNALFAFVIAIGLGFSGYSLIELAGAEVTGFVKRVFKISETTLPEPGDKSEDPSS